MPPALSCSRHLITGTQIPWRQELLWPLRNIWATCQTYNNRRYSKQTSTIRQCLGIPKATSLQPLARRLKTCQGSAADFWSWRSTQSRLTGTCSKVLWIRNRENHWYRLHTWINRPIQPIGKIHVRSWAIPARRPWIFLNQTRQVRVKWAWN